MNFAYDSVKLQSKPQNEDFCFEIETPQGHFFAVLDFAPHDYANLNATLQGKLETVVASFTSLATFSADLFLGFLAKEVNNFLHHLGEQAGPEMKCSAGLCLVHGNRLSYLLCGDVRIDITGGRLLSLNSAETPEVEAASEDSAISPSVNVNNQELKQFGAGRLETPITDRVQRFSLRDDDVILIMTHGLEAGFDRRQLPNELVSQGNPEPKLICDALMRASASSRDDRTVVVIAGPYERDIEPVSSADLSKTIADLAARVNTLAEDDGRRDTAARASVSALSLQAQQLQKVTQQIDALRGDFEKKSAGADLQQLHEKLDNLNTVLGSKADAAEVLRLQQDVLKIGKVRKGSGAKSSHDSRASVGAGSWFSNPIAAVLLVLVTAIVGAFLGAWLQSRAFRKNPEVWVVKTTPNQILISRLDENDQSGQTVSLNISEPLRASGEQTFSSFADVKQYIDTVTSPVTSSSPVQANLWNQPTENTSNEGVTEITVQSGDSLRKFAERYKVPQEKLRELNPTITKWTTIRAGQRIRVPSEPTGSPAPSPAADQRAAQPTTSGSAATIEVTVGKGDSLNRFVQRYNSTPQRLKELNPQITNWARIRQGEKLLVPAPPGG